ncbi:hypothetical protein ACFQ34_32515 [Pseudonocardia benzenivorans]|jgi:hypothetical protein|uniref:Uncharacterized protein n=1 Tax=Pseudonocardia benzenivorans TaxID=228005 RepID=A0ABW3VS09_9PSEU|nr:hypothetical protein PSD17_68800 [Pseudonocardia sp. D17]
MTSTTELYPGADDDRGSGYRDWIARVTSTYEAIHYTCAHRLNEPSLAGQVAVQVVAGLIARPMVFRYFGLPYSGRIATLAEGYIADAEAGNLTLVGEWPRLYARLREVPAEHQEVFVGVCVAGDDLAGLAERLGCDEREAAPRRTATLELMRDLASAFLPESFRAHEED